MFKPIPVQHYGAGKKKKIIWHNIKFQDSRLSNIPFFKSYFDLLISQLPDFVENVLCTPDGAMDLIFQIKYISNSFVYNLMEILITKQIPLFFEAPCMAVVTWS